MRTDPIDRTYFADGPQAEFTVIGSVVQRSDALGHVTGRTTFFEDVTPPDLLHLKMYRSPRHHARITEVDLTEALAVPGVVRVLTHDDIPNNVFTLLSWRAGKYVYVGSVNEPFQPTML